MRALAAVLLILTLAGCAAPTAPAPASATHEDAPAALPATLAWRALAPMPVPRAEHEAAVVAGKIYAIGGYDFNNNVDGVALGGAPVKPALKSVDVYDIATDKWSPGPDYPVSVDHEAVAVVNGTIFVFFGQNSFKLTPPATEWKHIAAPPFQAMGAGADEANGTIYVAGWGAAGSGGGLARYDPATDRYETLAAYPEPRNHGATAFLGGKYYVGNGDVNSHSENTARTVAYDPATNAWSDVTPNPVIRGSAAGVDWLGRFLVLGGQNQSTGVGQVDDLGVGGKVGAPAFADVHAYDPLTNAWTKLPGMPHGRHGFGAVTWQGKLYAVGGAPQQGVSGFADLSVLEAT